MSDLLKDWYETVRDTIKARGIKTLVETGTGPRSSGLLIAELFDLQGYSCDVYLPCIEDAAKRHPNAKLYHAESIAFLRHVLPEITGPTFFWLDGHCPTDPDTIECPVFPPFEEILAIKELKPDYAHDVFWLDDIPMVTVDGNPVRTEWDVFLNKHGGGIQWRGETAHSWEEYMTVLADTHTADVAAPVLRYTPK